MQEDVSESSYNRPKDLRTPYILLLIYTVLVLGRPNEILPGYRMSGINLLVGGAAITFALVSVKKINWSWINLKVVKYMSLFIFAIIFSVPFSLWPGGSVLFLTKVISKQILMLLVMLVALSSVERINKLITVISLCGIAVALVTIINYRTGSGLLEGYRATITDGVFSDPNDLALHFVFSVPLLYFNNFRRGKKRVLSFIGILILISGILITFSRGGILGLSAVCIVIWYLDKGMRKINFVVFLCVLIMTAIMSPEIVERMKTIGEGGASVDGSISARLQTLKFGIEIFAENPVLGVGVSCFSIAEGAKHGKIGMWSAAHNSFVQVAAETGVIGLIAFVGSLASLLKGLKKVSGRIELTAKAVTASAVGFIVSGTFLSQAYSWYFFYLVGLAAATISCAETSTSEAQYAEM